MNSLRSSSEELDRTTIGIGAVCALGCASSVFPWLDVLVGQVLAVLTGTTLITAAARWATRWLREYREDRADIAHVNASLTARARTQRGAVEGLPVGGDR